MRKLTLLFVACCFFQFNAFSQTGCISLVSHSLTSSSGGNCTYEILVEVNSGNGASGNVDLFIDGTVVSSTSSCVCNPDTITFAYTTDCGDTIEVTGVYDAPGGGNDCSGSTGEFTLGALPVELGDFSVSYDGNQSILEWFTFSEINNEHFEIQHSQDGIIFQTIGLVPGSGTSNVLTNYSFVHEKPGSGKHYYRLLQKDFDGSVEHSKILFLEIEQATVTKVGPNPFSRTIEIHNPESFQWELFDLAGILVKEGDSHKIETLDLPDGLYQLKVSTANREENFRLLKVD